MNLICTSKTSGCGTSGSCRSGRNISGSDSSGRGSAGLVAVVMAVTIGEGTEGTGYVMFAIGKSRRVFYVFLKAPIANHSDPNPLK